MREPSAGRYDVVVVGGGTAGCALAYRLSEGGERRVLLLEAGTDYGPLERYPAALRRSHWLPPSDAPHLWSYRGRLTPSVSDTVVRGRVMGGSSAVNAGQFTRGTPADYDAWASRGNHEWSYAEVLPYFRRLEDDLDFPDAPWHGHGGPVPVVRPPGRSLTAVADAFVEASLRLGFPWDPDMNAPASGGVGTLPHNVIDGVRRSAATCYLEPAGRRPGLTVVDRATAVRVLFEGRRARGVEAVRNGAVVRYHGEEVVLSAGGLNSPHLLLLSGIGPAATLRRVGIPLVQEAPGVGRGFMDHPAVRVTYRIRDHVHAADDQPTGQVCLNYTSPDSPEPDDMRIFPYSRPVGGVPAGPSGANRRRTRGPAEMALYCGIDLEDSRGDLALVSADTTVPLEVDYRYLSRPTDLRRMRDGVRLARDLLSQPPFAALGAAVTGPPKSRAGSEATLDEWLFAHLGTAYHTSGTCAMGPDDDPTAVVDQYCRVRGVDGLRVVDVSVMPTLVRRGPNATAAMIGERASSFFD